jgi:hypothetical protein
MSINCNKLTVNNLSIEQLVEKVNNLILTVNQINEQVKLLMQSSGLSNINSSYYTTNLHPISYGTIDDGSLMNSST